MCVCVCVCVFWGGLFVLFCFVLCFVCVLLLFFTCKIFLGRLLIDFLVNYFDLGPPALFGLERKISTDKMIRLTSSSPVSPARKKKKKTSVFVSPLIVFEGVAVAKKWEQMDAFVQKRQTVALKH